MRKILLLLLVGSALSCVQIRTLNVGNNGILNGGSSSYDDISVDVQVDSGANIGYGFTLREEFDYFG